MVLLWKEKNIVIPLDDIRKFYENKEKFWVVCKGKDDKLQICRVQIWEILFPTKFKEGYFDL